MIVAYSNIRLLQRNELNFFVHIVAPKLGFFMNFSASFQRFLGFFHGSCYVIYQDHICDEITNTEDEIRVRMMLEISNGLTEFA